jgi:hypothetical protein
MIFFGERSLRKATREYAAHYHGERNHQGIDNRLIEPGGREASASGSIECVQRLGGMLRFYRRAAAQPIHATIPNSQHRSARFLDKTSVACQLEPERRGRSDLRRTP